MIFGSSLVHISSLKGFIKYLVFPLTMGLYSINSTFTSRLRQLLIKTVFFDPNYSTQTNFDLK